MPVFPGSAEPIDVEPGQVATVAAPPAGLIVRQRDRHGCPFYRARHRSSVAPQAYGSNMIGAGSNAQARLNLPGAPARQPGPLFDVGSGRAATEPAGPAETATQRSFDDLGTPLHSVEFVVVDLETTGGPPADAGITEIGAVRVRGGEVLGEFQTLVNPAAPIPALITALTGLNDAAVRDAPTVRYAVSAFLDFAADAVLVAHNASYDVGFLRGACDKHDITWPRPVHLCTAKTARAVLLRDEVPNHKLATLAKLARSSTEPNHRALQDARATVDVLHYLIERVGDLGISTVEELSAVSRRVSAAQRRKRGLAEGLPTGPGVYVFRDSSERPLYVGTSKNIRTRVRNYFTASEKRTRMAEMVQLATKVTAIECATALEAQIRETRLIAEHRPPYNRRSKQPQKSCWIRLTNDAFPRWSIVSAAPPDPDAALIGPFPSRRAATSAVEVLTQAYNLRTCTTRFGKHPQQSACVAGQLGRCPAPCDGTISLAGYADLVDLARTVTTDFGPVHRVLREIMQQFAGRNNYEQAALWRDRLATLARGCTDAARFRMLAACPELVLAQPTKNNGWEVHVVRHGRLAGATTVPPKFDPRPAVEAVTASAEVVAPGKDGLPPAHPDEVRALLSWMSQPGVRPVVVTGVLAEPTAGAAAIARNLSEIRASTAARNRRAPDNPQIPRPSRIAATY